jgi:phosphotriesterase-related protein
MEESGMINTVGGAIEPEDLGIVAMGEHILWGLSGWENDPWIAYNRPQAVDALLTSLREFKEAGGKTIVDSGGILRGRDAELFGNLSSSGGIHIVASTGLGNQHAIPSHFLASVDPQKGGKRQRKSGSVIQALDQGHFADLFYLELTQGMVIPGMMRSKLRAGVVTADSSWDKLTDAEEVILRAAAQAAKKAGVAVIVASIHQGSRQIEILLEEGLEADRIVIGHCDDGRALDLKRDQEFAKKGVCVAYDHIGWEDSSVPSSISDEFRVKLVKGMVDAGLSQQIVMSCSAIGSGLGVPQSKHSFSHLLKSFVPRLDRAGVPTGVIDTILRDNPKRILNQR